MDKQYYPVEIEEKWVKIWAERKVSNKESDDSFSQVIPPPNVTGTLHMGHSFQYAIMDFYTRYHHMSGKDSYWQVGSDHAGIATQMVVENNLAKKDISRLDLGREKFLEEVWSWKEFSEEKNNLHKLKDLVTRLTGKSIDLHLMTAAMKLLLKHL
jgi:valyl-tRNA synthetase